MPRQTHDVDIVADLSPTHGRLLAAELESVFYLDAEMIEQGIKRRTSFNLIPLASGVKIDLFPKGTDAFDEEELARSIIVPLGNPPRAVPVKSAEDVVLRKLQCFRRGGEVSDRQRSDVVAVLRIQGERRDYRYLSDQAAKLGIGDLLASALQDAL